MLKHFTYKQVMTCSCIVLACLATIYMIPVGWIYLAITRALVAIPVFFTVQCVPIWLAPHADPKIRGKLSAVMQVGFNTGMICSGLLLWCAFSPYPYTDERYNGVMFFLAFLPNVLFSAGIAIVCWKFDENRSTFLDR